MFEVIICIFLLVLLLVFYEDYKERAVSLLYFLILFAFGGFLHYKNCVSLPVFMYTILFNFFIIGVLVLILYGYTRYKMKQPLFETIGTGDLLFFGVLAIGFPSTTFLILFSTSLLFSSLIFILIKPKLQYKTVPLAGLQALFLFLIVFLNALCNFVNLYAL